MADYAISNVPRRVVYSPSGVGPYAFTFEILSSSDIAVYKGDTLLTLTTDYTVTINANGTGSVTLVATAGTSNITIVGSKTIQRTTDFTTGGDFFANTLNDELDAQTIFIQQVAETAERGMKAPVTDPTDINMTLPRKADRAGKYLAFDANGNPEPGPTSSNVDDIAAIVDEIETLAAIDAQIVTVAGQSAQIATLAPISSSITTVASISASVVAASLSSGCVQDDCVSNCMRLTQFVDHWLVWRAVRVVAVCGEADRVIYIYAEDFHLAALTVAAICALRSSSAALPQSRSMAFV